MVPSARLSPSDSRTEEGWKKVSQQSSGGMPLSLVFISLRRYPGQESLGGSRTAVCLVHADGDNQARERCDPRHTEIAVLTLNRSKSSALTSWSAIADIDGIIAEWR